MDDLLKQARKLREREQRERSKTLATVRLGKGAVVVKIDGHKHLRSVKIAPEAIDPENLEKLEQLLIKAINRATDRMEATLTVKYGPSSGIPDLLQS